MGELLLLGRRIIRMGLPGVLIVLILAAFAGPALAWGGRGHYAGTDKALQLTGELDANVANHLRRLPQGTSEIGTMRYECLKGDKLYQTVTGTTGGSRDNLDNYSTMMARFGSQPWNWLAVQAVLPDFYRDLEFVDVEGTLIDGGRDDPHRDEWDAIDDEAHYSEDNSNFAAFNHFIDIKKGPGRFDDFDGYSYHYGSASRDQYQNASDATSDFWAQLLADLGGYKVDGGLVGYWYNDEYVHAYGGDVGAGGHGGWYRECSPSVWRYSFPEDKGVYTSKEFELRARFPTADSVGRSGKGIPYSVFMPVDNMARYWYGEFLRTRDLLALGPVMHAVQDASVPHHAAGYLGNWHDRYEENLGRNIENWLRDPAFLNDVKQLVNQWSRIDPSCSASGCPVPALRQSDWNKTPAINWRVDQLVTWMALNAYHAYDATYNHFRGGFRFDAANAKELTKKALAISALVLKKAAADTGCAIYRVRVDSPRWGATLQAGTSYRIRWTVTGGSGGKVKLWYRLSPTAAWRLIGCADNTGVYLWTVPNVNTARAKIKISWYTGCEAGAAFLASAESGEFTIRPRSITLTSPNGGERWFAGTQQEISWSATAPPGGGQISLFYSTDSGSHWTRIACVPNPAGGRGTYLWRIPHVRTAQARVKAEWVSGCDGWVELYTADVSDGDFTIYALEPAPVVLPGLPVLLLPAAPTALTATAVSATEVALCWQDNAANETGFKVERRTGSGGWTAVGTVAADVYTYRDTGCTAGTEYFYRVCAFNTLGSSDYSNEAAVHTPASGEGPSEGEESREEPSGGAEAPSAETVICFYLGESTCYVNDEAREMDTAPVVRGGRTLLPIRFIAEPLGAAVNWIPAERKVTVSLGGRTIELWIGRNTARVDGGSRPIDPGNRTVTPVVIPPGRTMLPLRFVAENIGCRVDWDPVTREAKVTYPGR
ncbi:MAG: stalk domain-containing protein [Bacillota bacterium]